jgi:hypothetical protein
MDPGFRRVMSEKAASGFLAQPQSETHYSDVNSLFTIASAG